MGLISNTVYKSSNCSIYLRVIADETPINGTLLVRSTRAQRRRNIEPATNELLELTNGTEKIIRYALANDEKNAELIVLLNDLNNTVEVCLFQISNSIC